MGVDVGAWVETLMIASVKVVGATKALVSSVTPGTASASAVASGLSSPVTASVSSSTSSANTSAAETEPAVVCETNGDVGKI